MRAIRHLQGETNIADALETTRRFVFDVSAGDRADAANLVVLVTDGRANRERDETDTEASLLKAQGAKIVWSRDQICNSHDQWLICLLFSEGNRFRTTFFI